MTDEELLISVQEEIKRSIIGKDDVVRKVLCAILARGHVLIEDIPGLGKTTMAMAIASVCQLGARRLQFTPDVLPSDIVGFNMYDKETGNFRFVPGVIFTNLFLADEINRTSRLHQPQPQRGGPSRSAGIAYGKRGKGLPPSPRFS